MFGFKHRQIIAAAHKFIVTQLGQMGFAVEAILLASFHQHRRVVKSIVAAFGEANDGGDAGFFNRCSDYLQWRVIASDGNLLRIGLAFNAVSSEKRFRKDRELYAFALEALQGFDYLARIGGRIIEGDIKLAASEAHGYHTLYNNTSPGCTRMPFSTAMRSIVPLIGATISLNTFIASIKAITCPAITASPTRMKGGAAGLGAV